MAKQQTHKQIETMWGLKNPQFLYLSVVLFSNTLDF